MSDPTASGREANEADVAEQTQPLDPDGAADAPPTPPDVTLAEANEADALEQGATIDGDEDLYPHATEQEED